MSPPNEAIHPRTAAHLDRHQSPCPAQVFWPHPITHLLKSIRFKKETSTEKNTICWPPQQVYSFPPNPQHKDPWSILKAILRTESTGSGMLYSKRMSPLLPFSRPYCRGWPHCCGHGLRAKASNYIHPGRWRSTSTVTSRNTVWLLPQPGWPSQHMSKTQEKKSYSLTCKRLCEAWRLYIEYMKEE